MQLRDGRLEEAAYQMRAGDVKVGEVGGVGFVEVVIAFCEWGVGSCYSWEEEGRRRYFCRDNAFVKQTMAQYGVVNSNLWCFLALHLVFM